MMSLVLMSMMKQSQESSQHSIKHGVRFHNTEQSRVCMCERERERTSENIDICSNWNDFASQKKSTSCSAHRRRLEADHHYLFFSYFRYGDNGEVDISQVNEM